MHDDWDDDRVTIEEALLETNAIRRCPVHEELVDNLDPGAQEETIDNLEGEYGRERAEELVKRAIDGIGEECHVCPGDDD
jgi:hypothetical protein